MMFAFTCELGRFAFPVNSIQSLREQMITSDSDDTNHYISVSFPQVKWSIDVNTYVDICYDLMITNSF